MLGSFACLCNWAIVRLIEANSTPDLLHVLGSLMLSNKKIMFFSWNMENHPGKYYMALALTNKLETLACNIITEKARGECIDGV